MEYTTYKQLDQAVDELYATQQFNEAIELLTQGEALFPDNLYEILLYKFFLFMALDDHDRWLTALETMVDNNLFTGLEWEMFNPIRDNPRFKVVVAKNAELRAAAQKQARMTVQVHTPANYTPEQVYPLFIALHGDGHKVIDFIDNYWPTETILAQGFILVYVQSSQIVTSGGYGWTLDYATTRADVNAAYEAVAAEYAIDHENILIGGFSGGSIAAIEITMADTIPVKGFVSLCPSLKPASFTPENVASAAQRGVRGVLFEGELEGDVPAEQEMVTVMREVGFPYQFILNPGIGHAAPADFPQKLVDAIAFINGSAA